MANPYMGSAPTNLGMGNGAMQTDWNNAWANNAPGSTVQYGSGNIKFGDNNTATYTNGQGQDYRFSKDMSFNDIANGNSDIASAWKQQYGFTPDSQSVQPGTTATGAASSGSFGNNPWLQAQGQALQALSNQNLKQNVLPGIGQSFQAAGGYGGTRQGIAEGVAMGNAQTGLNNALANMYSQSYGQDQQYDLGNRGLQNQYSLGMGNLALGNKQADNSFNMGMANLDSNNAQFGANYGLNVLNSQNQWANNNALTANQIAQTPLNYFNQFNSNASQIAGQGGTTSQTNQGNPWLGALGGAQLGYKLWGGG